MDEELASVAYELRLLEDSGSFKNETKGSDSSSPPNVFSVLVSAFNETDFKAVFHCDYANKLFSCLSSKEDCLDDVLCERLNRFLNGNGEQSEKQLVVLLFGAAALQLFVLSNWASRSCFATPSDLIPILSDVHEYARNDLTIHGLQIYEKTRNPEYLWLAKAIFSIIGQTVTSLRTVSWWKIRSLYAHQQTLDDRSPKLYEEFCTELVNLVELTESLRLDLRIRLHFELSQIKVYYYQVTEAGIHLEKAQNLAKLDLDFTGVLGKRTRFQQKDVAQLVVRVLDCEYLRKGETVEDTDSTSSLPKNIALNDDVRLEKISLNDPHFIQLPRLSPVEQALHIGLCLLSKKNSPSSELKDEEIMQFVMNVLADPKCWSIEMMALFLRSKLEGNHRRTVERAMMQMQVLVDQYKLDSFSTKSRLRFIYMSCLPPFWVLEAELANLLCKMGAVNSALDVYLDLHMWNEVISCYQCLHRKEKAEAVIREQLAINETPVLWCHLGDATDNPEYYLKAWEMSKYRLARAQKSLGIMLFQKKKYEESVPHFVKCVEVNSLQLEAWSCLAFASMQVENWDLAAKAYRRCTNLESENHEVWNNLANVYLKLKDKERAWRTLQEALRCSFEDWRIWENYLLVSLDCRAFSEVIKAYHRLMDLKGKHVDTEVLGLLVKSVRENIDDYEGKSASILQPKLAELFGRITASVTNDGHIWKLYSELSLLNGDNEDALKRMVQYLHRAHRCFSQVANWERDQVGSETILKLSSELAQASLKLASLGSTESLAPIKLSLNGTVVRVKQYHSKVAVESTTETISSLLNDLEGNLSQINDVLKNTTG